MELPQQSAAGADSKRSGVELGFQVLAPLRIRCLQFADSCHMAS
jgi:hypothetical protein